MFVYSRNKGKHEYTPLPQECKGALADNALDDYRFYQPYLGWGRSAGRSLSRFSCEFASANWMAFS
jgi:hypothetical protein